MAAINQQWRKSWRYNGGVGMIGKWYWANNQLVLEQQWQRVKGCNGGGTGPTINWYLSSNGSV
jgi:hypothetical protein